ncbi:MAG TPA: heavy metal transporter [Clostridiales bacterium]|nr:heavy metal transporter [Clostridiales bacterium]
MQFVKLKIDGMTCPSCATRIERKLKSTKGVTNANVSYSSGRADITYDENAISIDKIINTIELLGYKAFEKASKTAAKNKSSKANAIRALGIAVILLALYMIMNRLGALNIFNYFPQAREGTGYGMLFIIGLLTSLHCVAMCGGINLSQCIPQGNIAGENTGKLASLKPSLLYNLGRTISYTAIGGIVGAIGSVVSFSGVIKGVVLVTAGVFMVIMGLNMLNIFPWLRRLNPKMPKFFAKKINKQKQSKSPFYVGLINGLMPCGPLQAMQLYALSTGSRIKGAVSMFLFSLGTVPMMFSFGAISSVLSKKYTHKMITISAVLVVFLGVSMLGNGMSLSGISLPFLDGSITSTQNQNIAKVKVSDNIQTVTTKLLPGSYEPITVQKGVPVRWTIKAEPKNINGCNNEIFIPKFNIEKKLVPGENIIEFTPTESGTFTYTCWMGMIKSKILVVDDINGNDNK